MKKMMMLVVGMVLCACAAQATPITFAMEGELSWHCPWIHTLGAATAEGTWGGTITFDLEYYYWSDIDFETYVLSYVSSDLEIYSGVTHEWGGDGLVYPYYEYWGTLDGATIDFRLYNRVCWYPDGGTEWEFLNYEMDFTVTFDMPTMGEIVLESDIASSYPGAMSPPEDLYAGTGTWIGNVSQEGWGYNFLPFTGTQIPEPATVVLAGAALAGLAAGARRFVKREKRMKRILKSLLLAVCVCGLLVMAALCASAAHAATIIFEVEGEVDWSGAEHFSAWSAEGTWGGTVVFDLQQHEGWGLEEKTYYSLTYVSSDLQIYSGVTHEWSLDPEYYPYDNWGTIGGEDVEFSFSSDVWDPDIEDWSMLHLLMVFAVTFDMPGPSWDTAELESGEASTIWMSLPEDLYAGTGIWTGTANGGMVTYGPFLTFTANQIPEPATIAMIGAALAGLMGLARRRR